MRDSRSFATAGLGKSGRVGSGAYAKGSSAGGKAGFTAGKPQKVCRQWLATTVALEEPAGHVAVLADFVAYLWLEEGYACESDDREAAEITRAAGVRFVSEHLSPVAARVAERLDVCGATDWSAAAHLLAARVPPPPPPMEVRSPTKTSRHAAAAAPRAPTQADRDQGARGTEFSSRGWLGTTRGTASGQWCRVVDAEPSRGVFVPARADFMQATAIAGGRAPNSGQVQTDAWS